MLSRGSPRAVTVLGMNPRVDLKSGDGETGPWHACCRSVTTDTTEPNTPDIPIRECFIDEEKIPKHYACILRARVVLSQATYRSHRNFRFPNSFRTLPH
jgi:hypothetical protein